MKPSDYYRRLSASIKEADVRLMAAVMSEHVGQQNAIRMDDLCQRVSIKDERKVQPAMFDMPEPEPDRLRYWR